MPWREITQNGLNALLNRCYDLKRPVAQVFPVSVTLRASLAKAVARRRGAS
jgi:LacI family transcriptional regulator